MSKAKKALIVVIADMLMLAVLVVMVIILLDSESEAWLKQLCRIGIVVIIPAMMLVSVYVSTLDKFDFDHPKGSYDMEEDESDTSIDDVSDDDKEKDSIEINP